MKTSPQDAQTDIVVYGTTWCPDCRRAKQFLGEQRMQYRWVDIEQDARAMAYVEEVNGGQRRVPTIVFADGGTLVEPSNAELAAKLGLQTSAQREFYELIVVGAGPAGLTAALYAAREGLETLVIERSAPGGQAGVTQMLDNFPGFDEGISGKEFAERLTRQARRFGVEILQAVEVSGVRANGRYREVDTSDGRCYCASTVLIATGAGYRRLEVPGEEALIGISVHFCATCDGAFYKGKDVLVIGGGNSGFEEGLFLTRFAREVTVLVLQAQPKASRVLQDKVAAQASMRVLVNRQVEAFDLGPDGKLGAVRVRDLATGESSVVKVDGVFVFVGMTPNAGFLAPDFERDPRGFLVTGLTMQTSVPGVFAAGDVRAGATAQAASAAGEGAAAALMIRQYLQDR